LSNKLQDDLFQLLCHKEKSEIQRIQTAAAIKSAQHLDIAALHLSTAGTKMKVPVIAGD